MADLSINTKYKMLSGYEIPALGFGVCAVKHHIFAILAYESENLWVSEAVL